MPYDYEDDYDDEYYDEDDYYARDVIAQRVAEWSTCGSMLVIAALTVLYVLSPIDFVPDLIPVAGQADDLAAVLAGGGSVAFLAMMRYVLRSRAGRWGCAMVFALASIGMCAVFYVMFRLFDSIF